MAFSTIALEPCVGERERIAVIIMSGLLLAREQNVQPFYCAAGVLYSAADAGLPTAPIAMGALLILATGRGSGHRARALSFREHLLHNVWRAGITWPDGATVDEDDSSTWLGILFAAFGVCCKSPDIVAALFYVVSGLSLSTIAHSRARRLGCVLSVAGIVAAVADFCWAVTWFAATRVLAQFWRELARGHVSILPFGKAETRRARAGAAAVG